jgi:hypothetical protein
MLGGRRFLLAGAMTAATALLLLAMLYLPFMRLSTLLRIGYGAQEHSIISAVLSLLHAHQVVLGSALLLVGITLPLLKWLYVLALALLGREIGWLHAPALRVLVWGPQDLVALAAAAVLIAGQETLRQHTAAGAYGLAGAIVAMALAYAWRPKPETPARSRFAAPAKPFATSAKHAGQILAALAGLSLLTFGLGVTQPVIRLTATVTSTATGSDVPTAGQSIVDLVLALQAGGDRTLWVPLVALALLLPALRQLYLLTVMAAGALPSVIGPGTVGVAWILGRHATADTLLLGLGLFYLMETQAADRVLLPGTYCLIASAALTLIGHIVAGAQAPAETASSATKAARIAAAQGV